MSWHLPDQTVQAYRAGTVTDADAWSIEAHLTACERCRRALATDDQQALDASWAELAGRLPAQGKVRAGTWWRQTQVLAAGGPAARLAWLAACVAVLGFAAALSAAGSAPWFGVLAPIVPLLGVAASYGSGLDDAYEIIASTPSGGLRLLLIRSATVLAATTPVALVAGGVTGYGSPAPWLLASLAVTLAALALGSVIGVERAAAVVGLTWLVAVGASVITPSGPTPALLTTDAVPALLGAIVAASAVIAVRRGEFNHLPIRHRTRIERSR